MNGKLIGVGVGRGAPDLLTQQAIRLIQTALAYTVDAPYFSVVLIRPLDATKGD